MRTPLPFISHFIALCIIATFFIPAAAQISSPSADYSDTLSYPEFPEIDHYFIFHTPDPSGTPVMGELVALAPGGIDTCDFSWSIWDTASHSFLPENTDTGVSISRRENLDNGCYRVHITSAGLDTVFRAWVFRNDPHVEVEKDENGKVIPYKYTCDYLYIDGIARADTMRYYDLTTEVTLSLDNGMSFEWTSDNPDLEIFGAKHFLNIKFDYLPENQTYWPTPPTRDTRFTLTAVDSFGLSRTDDVLYESIHVKAEFSILAEDEETGEWIETDAPSDEAPFTVRFRNLSENGAEFLWVMVDSAKTGDNEDIITFDTEDSVEYTYYIPGYYYPRLTAMSQWECPDSFPLVNMVELEVKPSELDVPNVFTPNGDGANDIFMVKGQSLKNFKITIYNRSGRKVYEHEQTEEKFEWEGWDGTVFGKGDKFAEPGVYYYVIEALGWDATKYRGREPYKGFVYLFRDADQ